MDLNPLLRRAVDLGASDIHLKVGKPPMLRCDGAVRPLDGAEPLTDADLAAVLHKITEITPPKRDEFERNGDLDLAYQDDDLPRFRVNVFRQRGATSFAFRVIPKRIQARVAP